MLKNFMLVYSGFRSMVSAANRATIDGNIVNVEDQIPIAVVTSIDIDSYVKGYHAHQDKWTPQIVEKLKTAIEPDNIMDKYDVCVLKYNDIVGHLPKGKNGKFAKKIFFLRADRYSYCHAVVKGKPVNFGDGDGMQAPYILMIEGSKRFIVRLQENLSLS